MGTTRRLSDTEQSCLLPESEMRALLLLEWEVFVVSRSLLARLNQNQEHTIYIKKSILLLRCFIKRFLPAWNKFFVFVFVFRNQMFFRGMLRYYNYQALKFVL